MTAHADEFQMPLTIKKSVILSGARKNALFSHRGPIRAQSKDLANFTGIDRNGFDSGYNESSRRTWHFIS